MAISKSYPSYHPVNVFLYPLDLSSLLVCCCLALFISAALSNIFLAVLGAFGIGMFGLWYLKFAFQIVQDTAKGITEAPTLSYKVMSPFEDYRPGKFLIFLALCVTLIGNLMNLNPLLGWIFLIIFLVLLPGAIALLAIDNQLWRVLHPATLLRTVTACGDAYWFAFGLFCVMAIILAVLYSTTIGLFFGVFLTLYFILVGFHIIGITLYQQREELGIEPSFAPEKEQQWQDEQKHKRYQQFIDSVYQQRRQPATLERLRRFLENEEQQRESAYRWFYEQFKTWEQLTFPRKFVSLYLHILAANNPAATLITYQDWIAHDSAFKPEAAPHLMRLIKASSTNHDWQQTQAFIDQFLNDYPDDKHIEKILMLSIRIAMENALDDKRAREHLTLLWQKKPELKQDKVLKTYSEMLKKI